MGEQLQQLIYKNEKEFELPRNSTILIRTVGKIEGYTTFKLSASYRRIFTAYGYVDATTVYSQSRYYAIGFCELATGELKDVCVEITNADYDFIYERLHNGETNISFDTYTWSPNDKK